MASKSLRVNLRQIGSARIIDLPADLLAEIEEALLAAAEVVFASDAQLLVLDFSKVAYANSAGIGVLVILLQRAKSRGMPVVVTQVSGQPRIILERVGIPRYARVCESLDEALQGDVP